MKLEVDSDGSVKMCDTCGKKIPQHSTYFNGSTTNQCCQCYVLDGNSPSDWHPLCMSTHRNMKANDHNPNQQ